MVCVIFVHPALCCIHSRDCHLLLVSVPFNIHFLCFSFYVPSICDWHDCCATRVFPVGFFSFHLPILSWCRLNCACDSSGPFEKACAKLSSKITPNVPGGMPETAALVPPPVPPRVHSSARDANPFDVPKEHRLEGIVLFPFFSFFIGLVHLSMLFYRAPFFLIDSHAFPNGGKYWALLVTVQPFSDRRMLALLDLHLPRLDNRNRRSMHL